MTKRSGGWGQGPRTYRTIDPWTEFLQKVIGSMGATLFGWVILAFFYGLAFIIKEWVVPCVFVLAGVKGFIVVSRRVKVPKEDWYLWLSVAVFFPLALGLWSAGPIWAWASDLGKSGLYLTVPFLVEAILNFGLARNAMQLETADSYWPGETRLRDPGDGPAAPQWLRDRYPRLSPSEEEETYPYFEDDNDS